MNAPERWSRFGYRGRNEPKRGRGVLERAKTAIGPFELKHSSGTESCSCEKCMEQAIDKAATVFNTRRLVLEGAPRKKTVFENLKRVREGARSFADLLIALDDYSRNELLNSLPFRSDDPLSRLCETAQIWELPTPETSDAARADGAWVERLTAATAMICLPWDAVEASPA